MSVVATLHTDIRAAFRTALQAVPSLPAARAWEGQIFQPTKDVPFVEESMQPIVSEVRALGRGGNVHHRVRLIATLKYPAPGIAALEAMAGTLLDHFAPVTVLVYGSTSAMIIRAERGPVVESPDWLTLPVMLTAVAYSQN